MTKGISAFGTLLQRGDGVTPSEGFTTIAELTNIEAPAVESDIYDMTHHTSPGGFKEYVLGLRDGGEVTLEGNYIPRDATQNAATGVLADNLSGVVRHFKIIFSDAVAAVRAALNATFLNPNANIRFTAAVPGVGGNAVQVAVVVPAGAGAALGVVVAGNVITINVATAGAGVASSTAAQVLTALAASGPATALATAALGANADGTGIVTPGFAATNLAGGADAIVGTIWSFSAFVRNFVARAPHDNKLSFRGTLKVTGQPTLA